MIRPAYIFCASMFFAACGSQPTNPATQETDTQKTEKVDNEMTRYVEQLQKSTERARENADLANKRIHQDEKTYQDPNNN